MLLNIELWNTILQELKKLSPNVIESTDLPTVAECSHAIEDTLLPQDQVPLFSQALMHYFLPTRDFSDFSVEFNKENKTWLVFGKESSSFLFPAEYITPNSEITVEIASQGSKDTPSVNTVFDDWELTKVERKSYSPEDYYAVFSSEAMNDYRWNYQDYITITITDTTLPDMKKIVITATVINDNAKDPEIIIGHVFYGSQIVS